MSSLPFRNKTLVIAVIIYAERIFKAFWFFPILLDFFTLSHALREKFSNKELFLVRIFPQ